MASVLFKQGTLTEYNAVTTKDSNTWYVCTDTGDLYKGTVKIGDVILTDASTTADISSPIVGKFYYLTTTDIYYYCKSSTSFIQIGGAGTGGDVTGPSTATDSSVTLFNGTTGKIIKSLSNGTNGQVLKIAGGVPTWGTDNTGGDVFGPSSSVTGSVAVYDGTTGKIIKQLANGSDGQVIKMVSGVPAWGTDNNTTYSNATTTTAGLESAADKTKLDGIATGAQVNVLESVKLDGTALTITNKAVDITEVVIVKGTLAGGSTGAYGALTPAANAGHLYFVSTSGMIDGVAVEAGDILICTTDSTIAATSSNYATIAQSWNYIQVNVDSPLSYKGTLSGGSVSGYGALTPAANAGYVYVIDTAGKIDGLAVESGDMLICKATVAAATSSTYTTVAASWNIVQANVDGAVTTASTLTSGQLVIGNGSQAVQILPAGTNGQIMKMVSGTPTWSADQTIPNGFSTIAVSGQSSVVADSIAGTVALAAGSDITITTNATTDTVTIAVTSQSTSNTTSSASPTYGGTFTALDGVTVSNGRVTAVNTKTVTLPTLEWGTIA